jgi:hypothetical protein
MVSPEIQPVHKLIGFAVVVVAVALLGTPSPVLAQSAASPKPAASDPGWDVCQARVEWQPVNHFLVTAGYGFSKEKLNGTVDTAKFGSKDIHLDYTLHGPVLGVGFHF